MDAPNSGQSLKPVCFWAESSNNNSKNTFCLVTRKLWHTNVSLANFHLRLCIWLVQSVEAGDINSKYLSIDFCRNLYFYKFLYLIRLCVASILTIERAAHCFTDVFILYIKTRALIYSKPCLEVRTSVCYRKVLNSLRINQNLTGRK